MVPSSRAILLTVTLYLPLGIPLLVLLLITKRPSWSVLAAKGPTSPFSPINTTLACASGVAGVVFFLRIMRCAQWGHLMDLPTHLSEMRSDRWHPRQRIRRGMDPIPLLATRKYQSQRITEWRAFLLVPDQP